MTAQLVLQFVTTEDLDSYDKLIRFEDLLFSLLGANAAVDRHDCGSGEMNIFIITQSPAATFALVQQAEQSLWPSREMRAAYRWIDQEDYICLWPPELNQFDVA